MLKLITQRLCQRGGRTFKVGQSASITRMFTRADVAQFANLSGDTNSIHTNTTESVVVHGVLLMGLFSAIGGTQLPGDGAYLVQARNLKFHEPVYSEQEIVATLTVTRNLKNKFLEADAAIQDVKCQNVLVSGVLLLKV